MIPILIGMSFFFIAIGFIVKENNAEYLLSGYNTMSIEEQKKVNITAYIPYFRKFHVILGTSIILLGFGLYTMNERFAAIFIAVYPIIAYIFFFMTSTKYWKQSSHKVVNKISILTLASILLLVLGFVLISIKNNNTLLGSKNTELIEKYGEAVPND